VLAPILVTAAAVKYEIPILFVEIYEPAKQYV
jgi:hypothetical protein